jgi:hypothetical protein
MGNRRLGVAMLIANAILQTSTVRKRTRTPRVTSDVSIMANLIRAAEISQIQADMIEA